MISCLGGEEKVKGTACRKKDPTGPNPYLCGAGT